jgi:hypothetical protein
VPVSFPAIRVLPTMEISPVGKILVFSHSNPLSIIATTFGVKGLLGKQSDTSKKA